jgi:hypothetical protein
VTPLDAPKVRLRRHEPGLPWWRRALRFLGALILGAASAASAYAVFVLIALLVAIAVIVSMCAIPVTLMGGHVDVHPDPGASIAFLFLGGGLGFATVVFAALAIRQLVRAFARR